MNEPTSTDTNHLMRLLPKNRKVEALVTGFIVAQAVGSVFQKWRADYRARKTVTLKFQEGTEEYRWLCHWLSKLPRIEDESSGRVFTAKHLHCGRNEMPAPFGGSDGPVPEQGGWALVPDNLQGFRFGDMTLSIAREEPRRDEFSTTLMRSLVVSCITRDMDAVSRLLESIFEAGNQHDRSEKIPRLMALSTWGDWNEIRKVPSNRTPVLPAGVLESLLADAEWFNRNEEWYHSVGVPYRRGYLMHGIPGSGKTTTAVCMASKLKKDIYMISLQGLNDEKLGNAIRNAGRDGVLLIEDIDCATATNDRTLGQENRKDSPTLMGLLNAIDGAATPEGRILVATTNRREILDPALIRPGRFDRQFEFTHADYHQIKDLCRRFGSENHAEEWHVEKLSMADVQMRLIEKCGLGAT